MRASGHGVLQQRRSWLSAGNSAFDPPSERWWTIGQRSKCWIPISDWSSWHCRSWSSCRPVRRRARGVGNELVFERFFWRFWLHKRCITCHRKRQIHSFNGVHIFTSLSLSHAPLDLVDLSTQFGKDHPLCCQSLHLYVCAIVKLIVKQSFSRSSHKLTMKKQQYNGTKQERGVGGRWWCWAI